MHFSIFETSLFENRSDLVNKNGKEELEPATDKQAHPNEQPTLPSHLGPELRMGLKHYTANV